MIEPRNRTSSQCGWDHEGGIMLAESDTTETTEMTSIPKATPEKEEDAVTAPAPRRRRFRFGASIWVYVGVVAAAAGFGLIAYSWSKVAGQLNVGLQLPYLISAGLVGLGIVIVGVALAHFAALHRDSLDRTRQMEQVSGLLKSVVDELVAEDESTGEKGSTPEQ
ncbi:MAG: hypothetical protein ABR579_09415 [Actinomycetota bacterium]